MEGTPKHGREYYRCVTRTLAPGSPALAHDTRARFHLAERAVLPALNAWIGELFDRDNIDQTVAALLVSQEGHTDTEASGDRDAIKQRLADAEKRLSRLRAAIEAGADPARTDRVAQRGPRISASPRRTSLQSPSLIRGSCPRPRSTRWSTRSATWERR
jgi:hypothetical protein